MEPPTREVTPTQNVPTGEHLLSSPLFTVFERGFHEVAQAGLELILFFSVL